MDDGNLQFLVPIEYSTGDSLIHSLAIVLAKATEMHKRALQPRSNSFYFVDSLTRERFSPHRLLPLMRDVTIDSQLVTQYNS